MHGCPVPVRRLDLFANDVAAREKFMRLFFTALIISVLALFCISGAAQASVDHRLIASDRIASPGFLAATPPISGEEQASFDRIVSEPGCIALSGIGLLLVGGIIRRRHSKAFVRKRRRSLDHALDPVEQQLVGDRPG
jgi:hypothetical protein